MSQGIDNNSHVPTIAQAGPNVDAASKYKLHPQVVIEDVSESVAQKVKFEHGQKNSDNRTCSLGGVLTWILSPDGSPGSGGSLPLCH